MRLNRTKYSTGALVAWLWQHHKGCRLQASVNVTVGLLQVALSLLGTEMLRRLTDIATGSRSGSLVLAACVLGGVLLGEMLLNMLLTWVRAVLGVKAQNLMQQGFFARLLQGRWTGVERLHSGDVLNRLFGDVNDIVGLLTEVLPSAIIIVVQFVASFLYLFSMDRMMAIILVLVTPLFVLLSRFYFHRMRRFVRKIKDSNSALQAIIQESVQHKMVVKVLEQAPTMVDRLERRQALLRHQVKARARFSITAKALINIGFSGGYLAALVWGLFQLKEGAITVGVLMAFTQLISRIQRPLLDMVRLLPSLVSSMTSAERLMELEELPLEPVETPVEVEKPAGIRVSHVDYRYNQRGRYVLHDFSHDFSPGSFTAILGETGAGKTTLIRTMLALIEPTRGQVEIYNRSTSRHVSTATRCNFSYVPQGNTLFSGTIRENLLFGNPKATTAQMHEALETAMAGFVTELPDGIDTRCGEGGTGLSEGQAQRIAIARAILRPCSILLLDEATSALDIDTEHQLLVNLKRHFSDTTIIFVTHRLAVAGFTDQQFTMMRQTEKSEDNN